MEEDLQIETSNRVVCNLYSDVFGSFFGTVKHFQNLLFLSEISEILFKKISKCHNVSKI